jgi:hypothetical protein
MKNNNNAKKRKNDAKNLEKKSKTINLSTKVRVSYKPQIIYFDSAVPSVRFDKAAFLFETEHNRTDDLKSEHENTKDHNIDKINSDRSSVTFLDGSVGLDRSPHSLWGSDRCHRSRNRKYVPCSRKICHSQRHSRSRDWWPPLFSRVMRLYRYAAAVFSPPVNYSSRFPSTLSTY